MSDFNSVIDIVYQAGQNLKKHFGNVEVLGYKTTHFDTATPSDVVTKLDQETENFLESNLKKIDPTIGFTGEESGVIKKSDRFWLADPIDGTGFFLRGIWGCTMMLILIEDGQQKFSAIYDFIQDKMYTAEDGKGAYLNKKRIKVSKRHLNEAFVYIESHSAKIYSALAEKCTNLGNYPAGIHFALAAEGKVEGRICVDPYGKDYDFAPGQLLVKEAGGIVKNIGKDSFDYTDLNFLAVNKEVYEELTQGPDAVFPINLSL